MIPVLVSVLVVTCPCALSLATPAAMTAALGALARAGLIATRANAVERLALATHCLADKTGTLTEGRFRLRSVTTVSGFSESRCLALAAALEHYATHPAASALIAAADGAGGEEPVIGGMDAAGAVGQEPAIGHTNAGESVPSHADRAALKVEEPGTHTGGVTGRIDGVRYAVGSPEFVARTCGLDPAAFGVNGTDNDTSASSPRGRMPETAEPAAASAGIGASGPSVPGGNEGNEGDDGTGETNDGATHVFLACEGTLLARFVLADTLRADAIELIEGLRKRGIETTIASGDSAAAVQRAARELGVAHHLAGLSPQDKLDETARLAASGERVLMLGRRGQRCSGPGRRPRLGGDGPRGGRRRGSCRRGAHRRRPGQAPHGARHRAQRPPNREAESRLGPGLQPRCAAARRRRCGAALGRGDRHVPQLARGGRKRAPPGTQYAARPGTLTAMEILPLLIGISIVAVIAIAGIFLWAVRSGQFDDLDTPAVRILTDDDESPPPG